LDYGKYDNSGDTCTARTLVQLDTNSEHTDRDREADRQIVTVGAKAIH